jgi:hypothetical protein
MIPKWMISSVDADGTAHFHVTADLDERDAHLAGCRQRGEQPALEVWDPVRHPCEVQWESAA